MMDNQEDDIDWNKVLTMDNQQLKEFAGELQEALHLEQSKKAYELLLQRNQQCMETLDNYTDCLEQLGLIEEMQKILSPYLKEQQLILAYENNYKLLFKFAQTKHGKESIQYYEYGIQLLLGKLNQSKMRDLADGYAAIAEIYQTDLLSFKESEQGCVDNIQMAFKYDPMNLDAFLQLANYHLNKEDEEAAKKDLRVIFEKLQTDHEEYDDDFQLQVSKLMVEVEQYQEAIIILRRLVDSNQNDAEFLYMLAFALWKSQNYNESYKLVEGIIAMGNTDEEIWQGTLELKQQLEKEDMSQTVEEEWMDVE